MLGSFQHWRLCYQLLRLNRFICWLKTTKLLRNLKFSNLLSFLLRHPANAEGFPPVVTKTAHKNSSAFRQDTKQLLVLVDWRLNLKSKKKNTKISFNHIRWIQSISSSLVLSITGNIAPLWKQRDWKSDIPSAELHNYEHVDKRGNNVDHIPSWAGKMAETNCMHWTTFAQTKKCFTRNFYCKGMCHFKTRQGSE